MDHETLALIWFVLLGVLLAGYAILDGFDLGVGIMHLLVPSDDHERRLCLNSIGPLWDGNEVWLVVFGAGMLAAFPEAYASIFSGFYTAFMLLNEKIQKGPEPLPETVPGEREGFLEVAATRTSKEGSLTGSGVREH